MEKKEINLEKIVKVFGVDRVNAIKTTAYLLESLGGAEGMHFANFLDVLDYTQKGLRMYYEYTPSIGEEKARLFFGQTANGKTVEFFEMYLEDFNGKLDKDVGVTHVVRELEKNVCIWATIFGAKVLNWHVSIEDFVREERALAFKNLENFPRLAVVEEFVDETTLVKLAAQVPVALPPGQLYVTKDQVVLGVDVQEGDDFVDTLSRWGEIGDTLRKALEGKFTVRRSRWGYEQRVKIYRGCHSAKKFKTMINNVFGPTMATGWNRGLIQALEQTDMCAAIGLGPGWEVCKVPFGKRMFWRLQRCRGEFYEKEGYDYA